MGCTLSRVTSPYAPPPYPPYPAPPAMLSKQDEDQLNVLSILFYVYAAFVGLTGFAIGGVAVLPAILIPASVGAHGRAGAFVVGGVFLVIFGALALLLAAKAVVMVLAGRAMAQRSGYTMCMVGACVALMNIPLGTALGIFTITVLQKPTVKARFAHGA